MKEPNPLLAALKRATPWIGKLIADGGHLHSVAPNDAIGALQQMEAAIKQAETPLAIPALHLNGTSKGELIRQLSDAAHAVTKAHAALRDGAPHGRDYYVQPLGTFEIAEAQHIERLRKLEAVHQELEAIAVAVSDKEGGRP